MNTSYNKSKEIASIICPCCRQNPPKTSYKCVIKSEKRVNRIYAMFEGFGFRKGIFASKRGFMAKCILHYEEGFAMNPKDGIELFCRFRDGTVLYWNGNGARKDMGSEESAEMAEEYGHPGGCEGDGTIVQVNITEIWDKISPYLES